MKFKGFTNKNTAIPNARIVLILGIISILAAFIIGIIGYNYSFHKTKSNFQNFYLTKAEILANIGISSPNINDSVLLQVIKNIWEMNTNHPDDEYICIVDRNTNLILHTLHPSTKGNYVGQTQLLGSNTFPSCTLGDISGTDTKYVGDYISSNGDHQIAAFVSLPKRNWVIGVHRSENALKNEVKKGMLPFILGFIIVCCILFPLTIIQASIVFRKQIKTILRFKSNLIQSEERFRLAILSAPIPIMIHNEKGKVVHLNNEWERKSGYNKNELQSIHEWVSLAYENEKETVLSDINKLYNLKEVLDEGEYPFKAKNGKEVVWTFFSAPLGKDENGNRQIITTAIDVTEQKITANELRKYREHLEDLVKQRTEELVVKTKNIDDSRKALTILLEDVNEARLELNKVNDQLGSVNKELETFAYSVSHDLRAPLRHIHGFINLLKKPENQADPEIIKKYSEVITSSAQKMGKLIDDLLSFSRIGRNELKKQTFDLNEVIDEIINEYTPSLNERKIVFNVAKLNKITADRNLMRVVFSNLIENAIKFTRGKETAEISIGETIKNKNEIIIFIKDNGAGFDNKYVHKLFGVFQRLHTENEFEGTGIGLASVQRIIHKHGGKIWAEGEVNKGATFYISL